MLGNTGFENHTVLMLSSERAKITYSDIKGIIMADTTELNRSGEDVTSESL